MMEFELQIRQPGMPEHSAEQRIDKFHQLAGAWLPYITKSTPFLLTARIPTPEHEHSLTDAERKTMASFESLDYTIVESEIHRLRQQKAGRRGVLQERFARWIVYFVIGLSTGIVAFVIALCVEALSELRYEKMQELVSEQKYGEAYLVGL